MFHSNDYLLSKIIDSDVNDRNMIEMSSNKSCKDFGRSISTLMFIGDESLDIYFNVDQCDKRTHSIRAIMVTELNYLKRIRELLTDVWVFVVKNFDKIGKRHIIQQIKCLVDKFPQINDLHLALWQRMKHELQSTKEIGNILFEFLSQNELLDVYMNYVGKFSDSSDICQHLKEKGYLNHHQELMNLEAIITSPIQRFPQLSMAIADILKHTPDGHADKVPLFKAVWISKSITARLDRQRREFEYSNFTEMELCLQRLKIPFTSTQRLSNNSVYDVRSDYQIPKRITKLPYYLILCDKNVVMIPRDIPHAELTDKVVFCYSLMYIHCKQKVLSNFKDQINTNIDLEEARNMYGLVNDSFSNDVTVKEYESLLNDYKIMIKLNEDLRLLNFRYQGIDTLKLSKSLIELETQLKSKEIELNLQLGSILTLTIRTSNGLEFKKIFLFDSLRQSNEWRMNFNRSKLLLTIDMTICWKYYSFSKRMSQIRANELPVLFSPFVLKNNGIIDIPAGIVKAQCLALVVSKKIYRCVWVCLSNGWVVILHFDYKHWMVLESFKMENAHLVNAICVSSTSNIDSPDHSYDSEMWLSYGDTVLIHSLLDNQRSTVKKRLCLPSEIKSICNVDNRMFVALKSKKVLTYTKSRSTFWLQDNEFAFRRFLTSYSEEVKEIFYENGYVYVIFKSKIIVCKNTGTFCSPIKEFESKKELTAFFAVPDGVWVTVANSSELILYDKLFDNELQTISLPMLFSQSYEVGHVTSLYVSDKYAWLGTGSGLIICISTIDGQYCIDNNIPMYFSSVCSVRPITQLLPFQNIHGVNIKYSQDDSAKEIFDQRLPRFRRTVSNPPLDDGYQRLSLSCQNMNKFENNCQDELESSSNSSLQSAIENLRNTTPTLVLAFGCGVTKFTDHRSDAGTVLNRSVEHEDQSTLFTFLE